MKSILLLLLVAIAGCSPAPTGECVPKIDGAIEITIGKGRSVLAPLDSYTAGSKWIEHSIRYKNTSQASVVIAGYAETHPFIGIQTLVKAGELWQDYDIGYCGTGAKEFEIAPGKSYEFTCSLPERYAGHEFRVSLPFGLKPGDNQPGLAFSPAAKLRAD